jgi:hypothetical protein
MRKWHEHILGVSIAPHCVFNNYQQCWFTRSVMQATFDLNAGGAQSESMPAS